LHTVGVVLDPGQETGDSGVDTGVSHLSAADSEAHDADHGVQTTSRIFVV